MTSPVDTGEREARRWAEELLDYWDDGSVATGPTVARLTAARLAHVAEVARLREALTLIEVGKLPTEHSTPHTTCRHAACVAYRALNRASAPPGAPAGETGKPERCDGCNEEPMHGTELQRLCDVCRGTT